MLMPVVTHAQSAKTVTSLETYETHLGPTPVPDGAPTPIVGEGKVRAVLDGQTLHIEGQFTLKDAAATGARLMTGAGIGMPGAMTPTADVAATPEGAVRADVKLARDQLASLRAGKLFLLVTSTKSPAPVGHLWGWLLPAHPQVKPNEPQLGEWYLPQGAGLKSRSAQRGSKVN